MNGGNGHAVALWAALAAFFGNAIALKIGDLLQANNDGFRVGAALVVSLFVAASVYAKQRLDDAKHERLKKQLDKERHDDAPHQ